MPIILVTPTATAEKLTALRIDEAGSCLVSVDTVERGRLVIVRESVSRRTAQL